VLFSLLYPFISSFLPSCLCPSLCYSSFLRFFNSATLFLCCIPSSFNPPVHFLFNSLSPAKLLQAVKLLANLYQGDTQLDSQTEHQIRWPRVFLAFLITFSEFLSHDSSFPYSFQFISYYPMFRSYIVWAINCSVKWTTKYKNIFYFSVWISLYLCWLNDIH